MTAILGILALITFGTGGVNAPDFGDCPPCNVSETIEDWSEAVLLTSSEPFEAMVWGEGIRAAFAVEDSLFVGFLPDSIFCSSMGDSVFVRIEFIDILPPWY